jgi:hypothetical protein
MSTAKAGGGNTDANPEPKEWFERLPITTIIVVLMFWMKDKDYLKYSLQNEAEAWGIEVDLSLVRSLTWVEFSNPFHYNNYTLTTRHVQTIIATCILLLLLMMLITVIVIGEKKQKNSYSASDEEDQKQRNTVRKRLSWVLSMINSGFLFSSAVWYFQQKSGFLQQPFQIVTYITSSGNHDKMWYEIDNFGAIILIWFGVFNVMELMWGFVVAPEHLDPLTALFHHPMFTWNVCVGLTGSIIPFADSFMEKVLLPVLGAESGVVHFFRDTLLPAAITPRYTSPFIICFFQELPTFALALGSVFPSCRSDAFFGATFFLLRICHNFLLWLYCPMDIKKVYFSMGMLMHIFWFKTWCMKYLPKLLGRERLKTKGE